MKVYKGKYLKKFAMPVGGIGTGSISFNGWGGMSDFEIYGRPNKSSINGMTHMAVKAEKNGKVIDARVMHSDYTGHLEGSYLNGNSNQGFGPARELMAGFPHFKKVKWSVEYPFGTAEFYEAKNKKENDREFSFPCRTGYTVFNPLIPGDEDNSTIPAAFIELFAENNTDGDIDITFAFSLRNPSEQCKNIFKAADKYNCIVLGNEKDNNGLCIMTDENQSDVSYQENWFRGSWFDSATVYWDDFAKPGKLKNRVYDSPGNGEMCTIAVHKNIKAGDTVKTKFILSWHYAEFTNYWNPVKIEEAGDKTPCSCEDGCCDGQRTNSANPVNPNVWKNYYAVLFKNAADAAAYGLKNWDTLYDKTKKYTQALHNSSLPECALDAVASNISILKSPTCIRLEDGSFYGFEGCHCAGGCCEGSCGHVWAYQYALPFLFPRLERSMRDIEMKYAMRDDGGLTFRVMLPAGREKSGFRPCADGHFSAVFQIYREWKISGDDEWLRSNWDNAKLMMSYAWADTNLDRWDPDKSGVLWGVQHHTLDMELFGPNSWLTGFYLLALWCMDKMAVFMGDKNLAAEYRAIYQKGKKWVDENLFNGEYYHQKIDYTNKDVIEDAIKPSDFSDGEKAHLRNYWNAEHNEIKYQIAEGCGIDQVLAGYHAKLIGADPVFDIERQKTALKSLYKYNFKLMRDFANYCRVYSANDEKGLIICSFPDYARHAVITIPYTTETMNGFEYQAAAHMIAEGLEREGLEVVRAIRERYDGRVRNPFNEFECGSHYARSMASYALLNVYSGFMYDLSEGYIGFNPLKKADENKKQKFFFAAGNAFGAAEITAKKIKITILSGKLTLSMLKNNGINKNSVLLIDGRQINCVSDQGVIKFMKMTFNENTVLKIKI